MSRQRLGTLIGLGCAILALLLLASSLSGLTFRSGQFYDLNARLPQIGAAGAAPVFDLASLAFWQRIASFVFLALSLAVLIGLIFWRSLRRELLRRLVGMAIVVLLIYLVLSVLSRDRGQEALQPGRATGALPTPVAGAPLPTFAANPTSWLIVVISALLLALLLAAIWFFWRRVRAQASPLERLADEAQLALDDLQSGGDLKDTVLRCYREMSQILSEQRGVARPRDMTPREFEQQLAAVGLRDEHIRRLTRLFERVRYGARQAGEREEREAVDCLRAIARAYESRSASTSSDWHADDADEADSRRSFS
jgi:hypothetical protein